MKNRSTVRANIELVVQVAIAIGILITAGLLVKRSVFSLQASGKVATINVGDQVTIPTVNWAENKKTLVFFLMKDCQYCTSSAGFYRQIIAEASKRNVKCVAVFPNSAEEARKYLDYIEVHFEKVYTGPLPDLKIAGTPTVTFVDAAGVARGVWFGAQTSKEQDMRDKLLALFDS